MTKLWKMVVVGAVTLVMGATTAWARPSWCSKTHANTYEVGVADLAKETDPEKALQGLVYDLCFTNDKDSAEVAKVQAAWGQKLGLTDDDWNDVADWSEHYQGGDIQTADALVSSKLPWTKWSAIDQFAVLNTLMYKPDPPYLADAFGPKLTETGRLGFIRWCLGANANMDGNADSPNDHLVEWAACQDDIDAFDPSKLGAELDGDRTHSSTDRIQVRVFAGKLAPFLEKHKQAVSALFQKDPAYKKLFDVAHTAHASWKPTQTFVDLLSSTEDATITSSRRAAAGCVDKTWAAWQAAVAAIPAKAYEELIERDKNALGNGLEKDLAAKVIGTSDGFLAAAAFVQCQNASADHGVDGLAGVLSELLQRWPGSRGPRTEAITQILEAGIEFDDRNTRLDKPTVARLFDVSTVRYAGADVRVFGDGGVATVTKKGDSATITFALVKHTGDVCMKSHTTNRIERIDPQGNFVYEVRCDKVETVTRSWPASDPATAIVRYTTDVAPGVIVSVRDGVTVDVIKKGAKVPSAVLGVHVK